MTTRNAATTPRLQRRLRRARASAAFVAIGALLAAAPLNAAAAKTTVAHDMLSGSSSPLQLLSYDNAWTNAFSSIHDSFQKHTRGVTSPPGVLLDDSLSGTDADMIGIVTESDTDVFFGVADTINTQNAAGPVQAKWVFDITGENDLEFSIAAAAMGDFEGSTATDPDYFEWSYSIDGGPTSSLLRGDTDTSASQLYTMADGSAQTIDDPIKINGVALTNLFQTFTAPISETGSQLTIILEVVASHNNEATAFRNLEILAGDGSTPAPTPFLTCPERQCTSVGITETNPSGGGCSTTSGPAEIVTLDTYVHDGDVLIELLGPADPAYAADLVISSPHGGNLKPTYIPDRDSNHATYCPSSGCRTSADSFTIRSGAHAFHSRTASINAGAASINAGAAI